MFKDTANTTLPRKTAFSARVLTRMIACTVELTETVLIIRQIRPYSEEMLDKVSCNHSLKELAYIVNQYYRPVGGW